MEKEEPNKSSLDGNEETGESVKMVERKSQREKKNKRSFSPELEVDSKKKRKKVSRPYSCTSSSRPCDLLADGEPFCCKLCKSPYVTNPYAKGVKKSKRSRHVPLPKKRLDSLGREILVCNACCQILDRQIRPKKPSKELTAEERNRYLEDAKMFAKSLAETLNEPEAEKLYCPVSVYKVCGCLQKYIQGKDPDEEALELRVTELLDLIKEAAHLREQKAYTIPENLGTSKYSRRRLKYIGYGNGHKKSKEFEEFVLDKRRILKEDMRLCERATQRILLYSNNFLHKKLKTEERPCRITRTKGKAALGKLHDIATLHEQICCIDGCVRLSLTHPNLLKSWRSRAVSGQMEARKVIAEMLTPAGGYRLNCYQFVSMVTGCALTTIGKVNNQIRETGGRQDPPEHGMKRLWTNGQRNRTDTVSSTFGSDSYTSESQLVQAQSITGQEVTSEMLRTSLNQAGTASTNIFQPIPQGEMMRIEELMKKQRELQEQQQIVQYQIQQTLGQHAGLPQTTGWLTPQLVGPLSHPIGSANSSFVPAGNSCQTELPQYISSISNLALGQSSPGQFHPVTNQSIPVSKLNIPGLGQLGSGNNQIPIVTNQFFTNLNQVAPVISQPNTNSGHFQPIMGQSVCSSNRIQSNIEEINLIQKQATAEEPNPITSKTQAMFEPLNSSGSTQELLDGNDKSNSNNSQQFRSGSGNAVSNSTHFSNLNQNQFISNLSPTITTHFDPISSNSQPILKQVLLGTEHPHMLPEFMHQPVILSPVDPIYQQIQTEKQVGLVSNLNYTLEDINSEGNGNLNAFDKTAPNIMVAFVDQNGVTHQFAFPNTSFESHLFSVNNNPTALVGGVNPNQIPNSAEQQTLVQENTSNLTTNSLTGVPTGTQHMVQLHSGLKPDHQLGETSGSVGLDKQSKLQIDRQTRVETNQETSVENSNNEASISAPVSSRLLSTVNSSLSSKVPIHLEKVGIILSPSNYPKCINATVSDVSITQRVLPEVVDKSTNTVVEQINDQCISELNINETDANREDTSDMKGSDEIDTCSVDNENDRSTEKRCSSKEKATALSKTFDKNSSGTNSSDADIGNVSTTSDHNDSVNDSNGQRKHERKRHRSRHPSKEQGFQKLHSKNGKVFLHSNAQSRAESKELSNDTEDMNTYSNGSDAERTQISNGVFALEKTSVTQADVMGTSDSQNSKNKTHYVSERVKNKLRKNLNIPILPKTMKPKDSDVRIPVESMQSSLFVVPQSSQNITSLLHMTKSKVQVQPVLKLDHEHSDATITLPVSSPNTSVFNQPISQPLNQTVKPTFSNSLNNITISKRNLLSNVPHITRDAHDPIEKVSHGLNRNISDIASLKGDNIILSGSETDLDQTGTSLRGEQEALRASETGLTPDIRNLNIDTVTNSSTNLMAIGNLPPVFLQNIHLTNPPIQNIACLPSLSSPIRDQFLTLVKRTDGQSILTLPFSHSLKAPQVSTALSKPLKQRFSSKNRKSSSTPRPVTPLIPFILSASRKNLSDSPASGDHSPTQLVELSSDLIQQGVQEELDMFKDHPN